MQINITPETALFLIRDMVVKYQTNGVIYSKTRQYIMFMIFLANSMRHDWKAADGEFTIRTSLILPALDADRKAGYRYRCSVAYFREGLQAPETFKFIVNAIWAKILYGYYLSPENTQSKNEPIRLLRADDHKELLNIDDIVNANYGRKN